MNLFNGRNIKRSWMRQERMGVGVDCDKDAVGAELLADYREDVNNFVEGLQERRKHPEATYPPTQAEERLQRLREGLAGLCNTHYSSANMELICAIWNLVDKAK